MPGIKPIHWKKFEKFFLAVGCNFEREKGDHRVYWRKGLARPLVVPRDDELPVFIIRNNLRILNVSTEEYLDISENV